MSDPQEQFTRLWHEEAPHVMAFATRPTPPIAWLIVTARKVIQNRARASRRNRALQERIALLDGVAAYAAESADAALTRREALERLAQLDEQHREALLLVSWDGLTNHQAAAVLGIKPATFRRRLSRALLVGPSTGRGASACQDRVMSSIRLVQVDDVPVLVDLHRANREFLAPWEPDRDEEFFSIEGQLSNVQDALRRHQQGSAYPHVILDDTGQVIGRITVENIVRRAFQSCTVGYWVSEQANDNGAASTALHEIAKLAFDDLALHRIEAGTLVHNVRSQRVLEKNGFVRFGLAPAYLRIAGSWQDHVLYQALNPRQREQTGAVDP
jgi:ribosomal-protein-alanine N-acetyltransferase